MDNLPETIDITPDWQGMFRYAIRLTEHGLSKGEGQRLVVEMLMYGQRLQKAHQDLVDANSSLEGALRQMMEWEGGEPGKYIDYDDEQRANEVWQDAEEALKRNAKHSDFLTIESDGLNQAINGAVKEENNG